MHFEPNTIYHIYNQGNNRQRIFFKHENYLFFLRKAREYVSPYADFLCYCLMPNHFHWLVYVREPARAVYIDGAARRHPVNIHDCYPVHMRMRTLNESIGIMLRSYTRAINKQEQRTGALFREETKAKDGWENLNIPVCHPDYGKALKNWELYGPTAFQYIHHNPVAARLSPRAEDWPYSSAIDFAGFRNGTLCNQPLAKELLFLL